MCPLETIVNVDYHPVIATMTTTEAARRLGVKVETLYAYVSRGLLERHAGPDGRSSVFDTRAIEELARRGRPRQSTRSASLNLLIETRLTSLTGQGVRYRGLPARQLARSRTFEHVAELLWLGALPDEHHVWRGSIAPVDHLTTSPVALGDSIRLAAGWATIGTSWTECTAPADVAAVGRHLVATLVDSLPFAGDGRAPRLTLPDSDGRQIRATIAGRLWTKLSPRRPPPGLLAVVNAALVLMADHELAASTLAVRVAASTRAHPAAAVTAGLGTLSGSLHGGASKLCRQMMDDASQVGAARAVSNVLASGRRLPGFGHRVYVDADPRAVVLLDLLRRATGHTRAMMIVDDVHEEVAKCIDHPPNVDFALAALGLVAGMPSDGGEAIMSIARIAGWLAHAIEEYGEAPLRFRPRASYIGH